MLSFNPHPPLSGFPVALFTVTLLLEVAALIRPLKVIERWRLFFSAAAGVNLLFAVVFSLLTFLSGYVANELANFETPPEGLSRHHGLGKILLLCAVPCLALKGAAMKATFHRGLFEAVYLVTLVISFGVAITVSYLGGELVFVHGVGVSPQQR